MYLIDTNIVIWVIRGNTIYEDILQKLKDKTPLSISTITIAEIYKNVLPGEQLKTEDVLDNFENYEVTSKIAKLSGLYWQQYSKKYKNFSIVDCLIAATARENNLTLLTLNTRHFPMDDINVFDPLKKFKSN